MGGGCVIYLSPRDYHRVHSPCDGTMARVRSMPGDYFPVNSIGLDHIPNLFARNRRVAIAIDTPKSSGLGRVTVVMVAAMVVGRITVDRASTTRDVPLGDHTPRVTLERGDELGMFHLGSTVVLFFERAAMGAWLAREGAVRYGEGLARATAGEPRTPGALDERASSPPRRSTRGAAMAARQRLATAAIDVFDRRCEPDTRSRQRETSEPVAVIERWTRAPEPRRRRQRAGRRGEARASAARRDDGEARAKTALARPTRRRTRAEGRRSGSPTTRSSRPQATPSAPPAKVEPPPPDAPPMTPMRIITIEPPRSLGQATARRRRAPPRPSVAPPPAPRPTPSAGR